MAYLVMHNICDFDFGHTWLILRRVAQSSLSVCVCVCFFVFCHAILCGGQSSLRHCDLCTPEEYFSSKTCDASSSIDMPWPILQASPRPSIRREF